MQLRARQLRLRRRFDAIVASIAAAPLGALLACACTGDGGDGAPVADASATGSPEASDDVDTRDASIADGGSSLPDARACAPEAIDGAAFEDDAAPDGCATFHLLPCGVPSGARIDGCLLDLATCAEACGTSFVYFCQLPAASCAAVADGGTGGGAVVVDCVTCAGASGRLPRGLARARRSPDASATRASLGAYFATVAFFERASVRAFCELDVALGRLGAPPRLRASARRSAADERRHARATGRLARRFGGDRVRARARARVPRAPAPTRLELLEDDAVEGCVMETFGALVATSQAANATDARVRRTMRSIAADETRHAALAWEILHWGLSTLGAHDRARVLRVMRDAAARLPTVTTPDLTDEERRIAGLPTPSEARVLAREVERLVRVEAGAS